MTAAQLPAANDRSPPARSVAGALVHDRAGTLAMLERRAVELAAATDHPRGALLLIAEYAEEAACDAGIAGQPAASETWVRAAEALRARAASFPADPYAGDR
jgi:hypothetical protein